MRSINLERPVLNGRTPEENLAIIDTWIARTVDNLRFYVGALRSVLEEESIVLKAPDGTRYRITVDNEGVLKTTNEGARP